MLMWEICKNTGDAAKEFDRTMEYVAASINAAKEGNTKVSGTGAECEAKRGKSEQAGTSRRSERRMGEERENEMRWNGMGRLHFTLRRSTLPHLALGLPW